MNRASQVVLVALCAVMVSLPDHAQHPHVIERQPTAYAQAPTVAANSATLAVATSNH